jgi:hypothetical protein
MAITSEHVGGVYCSYKFEGQKTFPPYKIGNAVNLSFGHSAKLLRGIQLMALRSVGQQEHLTIS